MNTYRLHITSQGSDALYELKYSGGQFRSLRHVRGKLTQDQHDKLMMLCPQLEGGVHILAHEFKGRVTYNLLVNDKSLYTQLLDAYVQWYNDTLEMPPKIDGTSGNALKSIIKFLEAYCADQNEVIMMWDIILQNWNQLDKFYQNQRELRQINSNLNTILTQIKHGKSTGKTQSKRAAANAAHDFREGL